MERQSVQARALRSKDEYLLPVRIDNTEIPGVLGTVASEDLRYTSPEAIADLVTQKVKGPIAAKAAPCRDACDPGSILFELRCEQKFSTLGYGDAHKITTKLAKYVGHSGISIVGWELSPFRVELQAKRDIFERLQHACVTGELDSMTEVEWTGIKLLIARCGQLPEQTPIMLLPGCGDACCGKSIVCHLRGIETFRDEMEEAYEFVGDTTTNVASCRAYITGRDNWLYMHSNFRKKDAEYSTKIAIEGRMSLFTLLLNCLYREVPSAVVLEETRLAHQTQVSYFVNRTKLAKGDAGFYAGACNISFVAPRSTKRKQGLP